MSILLWIVFGALVGWIASLIMGSSQGMLTDIIVGIVGAVLGGWIMGLFNGTGVTGFNVYSFVVALIGSVVLIGIVRMIRQTAS